MVRWIGWTRSGDVPIILITSVHEVNEHCTEAEHAPNVFALDLVEVSVYR